MAVLTDPVSTDAYPTAARRSAWAGALADLSLAPEIAAGAAHSGEICTKRSATGARLVRLRSTPQRLIRIEGERGAEPILVILHQTGEGAFEAGRRRSAFADGDASVSDMSAPWALDLCRDFELLMLEVPRERFLTRIGRGGPGLPFVLGATAAANALRSLLGALLGDFEALGPADLASAESALVELGAGALLAEARRPAEPVSQVQAAHFRRVSAVIETSLANSELSIGDIAEQAGLSLRYLQRLFEVQSTTFSDHLRHRRLERARVDLADPRLADRSIADIAFGWGFRDQAHFSRAFSAAFGASPRAFRTQRLRSAPDAYPFRGRPQLRTASAAVDLRPECEAAEVGARQACACAACASRSPDPRAASRHHLPVGKDTVHWGFLSRELPPVLRVRSGDTVTVETLTQHALDDRDRMVTGDPGAESVFHWTAAGKNVDRRGAGPMNASIFGRGAGEGFGVHICTGPIFVEGAEPGDVLEVQILDIRPRPSRNPRYAGRAFGSNAAAWWGYQYKDLLDASDRHETVTIYEVEPDGRFARALYSYRWAPQTDPFGVEHAIMDYPGVPVDETRIEKTFGVLAGVRVPLRPHFGFMGVAPRETGIVDSIPPGYFGGNLDNWRAARGTTLYLPVAVTGALFSVGDGHLAQGDGEIDGTGLEASLTGDFRFVLHKRGACAAPLRGLTGPLLETPEAWVLQGLSYQNYLRELGRNAQTEVYKRSSTDLALRSAFRATRRFLMETYGLAEDEAISLMSVAVDFGVTQVADGNWGVHACVPKAMFE